MDPRPNQHQLYFPFEKKVSKENISFFSPYRLLNSKYYNHFSRNVKGKFFGDPYGNRTHVCGVRGRRLNRLTNGPSSERTAYRSFRPNGQNSLISSLLLFLADPLRWAPLGFTGELSLVDPPGALLRPQWDSGAPSGIRTRDPLIKSQLLYQLS